MDDIKRVAYGRAMRPVLATAVFNKFDLAEIFDRWADDPRFGELVELAHRVAASEMPGISLGRIHARHEGGAGPESPLLPDVADDMDHDVVHARAHHDDHRPPPVAPIAEVIVRHAPPRRDLTRSTREVMAT
jgi:hypothetical protein